MTISIPMSITILLFTINTMIVRKRGPRHHELYLSGQLCTHLHASMVDGTEVLTDEAKLQLLLFCMHLDYPSS